jgi:hypothetical protein
MLSGSDYFETHLLQAAYIVHAIKQQDGRRLLASKVQGFHAGRQEWLIISVMAMFTVRPWPLAAYGVPVGVRLLRLREELQQNMCALVPCRLRFWAVHRGMLQTQEAVFQLMMHLTGYSCRFRLLTVRDTRG